ncbi:hypothetical protein Fmac_015067 [Flemingia macrophylla]|uniref:Uncharacterized protein n=1 Tax=Flemingia macrophylla TaxID=520843 RepID=A0ABD1MDJ7_9FABA
MGKAMRHFRGGPRKAWWKLTVALLLTLAFFTLILFSVPSEDHTSFGLSKPIATNITHIRRTHAAHHHRRPDTWVEIISWEPRAFLYHNFLIISRLFNLHCP